MAHRASTGAGSDPAGKTLNMQEINFDETLDQILAKDAHYAREAYLFVREALDFTQKLVGKESRGTIRHVSGQELLDGIRQFALQQFGPMTATVFEEWGVKSCRDFGEIVFNMVENGGSPLLGPDDLLDTKGLVARLKAQADPMSGFVWQRLSAELRLVLRDPVVDQGPDLDLVKELNELIGGPSLYEPERFAGVALSDHTRLLLGRKLQGEQVARLNRFLLEDAFPGEIGKSGGLLAKTEKDSRADFQDGYDFFEAFRRPFLPECKLRKVETAAAPSSTN